MSHKQGMKKSLYARYNRYFDDKESLRTVCDELVNQRTTSTIPWDQVGLDDIDESGLNDDERFMYYCIQCKHPSGYVRERYVQKIININPEISGQFIIPLCGNYVVEILHRIEETINYEAYIPFIKENPEM